MDIGNDTKQMKYKLGLKLWSINTDAYYNEAIRLYEQGVYDYIELYVVPNTLETLPQWKKLKIPFIIHNAHFMQHFNLAKKEQEIFNRDIYLQTKQFADELDAHFITCSAKCEDNMDNLERYITTEAKRFIDENEKIMNENNKNIKLKNNNNKDVAGGKKKCC